MPSSTSEKWARVAAAALGGAAQGLANSQGPGGLAKAAAAGTQYGMNLPKQERENLDAQATAAQNLQMRNASLAKMQQDYLIAHDEWKQRNLTFTQQQAALMNGIEKERAEDPDANQLLGDFDGLLDVHTFATQHPEAIPAHLGQGQYLNLMPMANGKTRAYVSSIADGERILNNPAPYPQLYIDPNTGKMATREIAPSRIKKSDYDAAIQKQIIDNNRLQIDYHKANKPAAGTEEDRLTGQYLKDNNLPDTFQNRMKAKTIIYAAGRKPEGDATAGTAGPEATAAATVRDNGGSIQDALNKIPAAERNTIRAIGEGRNAPPSRFTKDGKRVMDMVNSVYPDYDATQFKTYQEARTRFTSGAEGQGMAFIQTARNHLARMEQNIPSNVTIPWGVGSLVNTVKNAANRSTDPKLKAFEDDMSAVSSEVARAYSGKALTDSEHDKMLRLLNESDSPRALRGAIAEFRELLNGKLQSYRSQWNAAMPRGIVTPNSMLENLEGGQQAPPPQPPPPPQGTQPQGVDWSKFPKAQ
jgi:hypothetical protein